MCKSKGFDRAYMRTFMRPAKVVKIGDEYLKDISMEYLKVMHENKSDYKVKTKI